MGAVSTFDPFSPASFTPNMANLTGLVPLATTYQGYFSHAETDTFCGNCAAILEPYAIDPTASVAATAAPANVARLIYAAV